MFKSIKNSIYFSELVRDYSCIENNKGTYIPPKQSATIVNRLLLTQRNLDLDCSNSGKFSVFSRLKAPYIYRKVFNRKDKSKALRFCCALLNKSCKVLITPYSNFSSVNYVIDDVNTFEKCWDRYAKKHLLITVELYQKGDPFKIFFKGEKIYGLYAIVPAFVVGDGILNLKELIARFEKDRKNNLLYSKFPLNKIRPNYPLEYVPKKGKVIKLKNSRNIQYGGVYIKLPEIFYKKFRFLIEDINQHLPLKAYTELTCFSRNIREGIYDNSFYISEIKQNSLTLEDLLSTCNNDEINNLLKEIGTDVNFEKIAVENDDSYALKTIDILPPLNKATNNEILKNAAARLGLEYTSYGGGLSLITERETGRYRMFFHTMSQYTLHKSRVISNNKMLTKQHLEKRSINTPMGICLGIGEKENAIEYIKKYLNQKKKWVLKPLQGSGGMGVTGGIESTDNLIKAWGVCEKLNCSSIILEEEVVGNDYRVVVIQDYIFSVTQRVAAYVVGDGVSTISELIKYKSKKRKQNPFYALKDFKQNQIIVNFLERKGLTLNTIPLVNEKIQLLDAVNIGSGGESIDKTNKVHHEWVSIVVQARKAIGDAFHAGIDLMAEDITISPKEQKWAIIEININPDLGLVLYPGQGASYDIGAELIKSNFGRLERKDKRCYELMFFGKVQQVGFRRYFQNLCKRSGISGFIWNDLNNDKLVIAKLYGYDTTVKSVINICLVSNERFVIEDIIFSQLQEIIEDENFLLIEAL